MPLFYQEGQCSQTIFYQGYNIEAGHENSTLHASYIYVLENINAAIEIAVCFYLLVPREGEGERNIFMTSFTRRKNISAPIPH